MKKITIKDPESKSEDLIRENIEQLKQIFPEVIKEGKVDLEALNDLLGNYADTPEERFALNWKGKANARREAQKMSTGTLRPCPEESVDWENTQNLYIEGDNLEVLKLLQKSYHNKVKMIYIDPPYNTGNDFVYKDNYKDNLKNYLEQTGQDKKLSTNPESDGRYHSNWLNMMYPRLKLARNLLKEDGAIFISIDDNEQDNLKKVCNEIFGESNFVTEIIREAIRGGSQSKNIRVSHDYVLVYSKNISNISFTGYEKEGIILNLEDENGKYAKGRELNKWGAGSRREDSPSMYFPITGPEGVDVFPIRNDGSEGRWRLGKEKMYKRVADGDVIFEKRENGSYIVYEKIRDNTPKIKQFTSLFMKNYLNSKGTEEIKKLFNIERPYFDYVKPIELMYDLLLMSNPEDDDIVLDFFSGSSSTAQSVIEFNNDFEKSVKFIMVQLPEKTPEDSEAKKVNFEFIPEIAKARIKKIKNKIKNDKIDYGFKVFKLDRSNLNDWDTDPDNLELALQSSMFHIKEDRSEDDLLYEILLKYGIPLDEEINTHTVEGKKIYEMGAGSLIICLDDTITSEIADGIVNIFNKAKPEGEDLECRVIFKDAGFNGSDEIKTNVELILKQHGITNIASI